MVPVDEEKTRLEKEMQAVDRRLAFLQAREDALNEERIDKEKEQRRVVCVFPPLKIPS